MEASRSIASRTAPLAISSSLLPRKTARQSTWKQLCGQSGSYFNFHTLIDKENVVRQIWVRESNMQAVSQIFHPPQILCIGRHLEIFLQILFILHSSSNHSLLIHGIVLVNLETSTSLFVSLDPDSIRSGIPRRRRAPLLHFRASYKFHRGQSSEKVS